jgi:hypothetical protein
MSGISDAIIRSITQVACVFSCDIGNKPISITGTGFFIWNAQGALLFITNKHNLDPTLMLGENTSYRLSKISLLLRKQLGLSEISLETKWFELKCVNKIKHSPAADVSVIYGFDVINPIGIEDYKIDAFAFSELADEDYINSNVCMMDIASFVGFPGQFPAKWWDDDGNFPIARTGNIASNPKKSFRNSSIVTDEAVVFSGLSFSGSSGSPIFLHQKGIIIQGMPNQILVINDSYVPAKIIGIMSGHWWDVNKEPNMFKHSGLSYYTKSTAIHELICNIS